MTKSDVKFSNKVAAFVKNWLLPHKWHFWTPVIELSHTFLHPPVWTLDNLYKVKNFIPYLPPPAHLWYEWHRVEIAGLFTSTITFPFSTCRILSASRFFPFTMFLCSVVYLWAEDIFLYRTNKMYNKSLKISPF